ncbi:MAG TPA: hypothetical protein VEI06_07595 [Gemmatimonadaceae bacterium]|nr:hypothetical protein [Gemmatimonadaceae bacterium]
MSRSPAARPAPWLALLASIAIALAPNAAAQGTMPDVGQPAPDFTGVGATRYGVLKDPVRLADYKGKTVVVAFFYKARTKG